MGTKARLMEVAGRLFAERGFDGVSVRDITAQADANLGAVTYHFGSKEGLFGAIIVEKLKPLRQLGPRVAQSGLSPKEKLSMLLMQSALHVLHSEPHMKAYFAEAMHGGERLPPEAIGSLTERNKIIGDIIREGIAAGEFRECNVDHATWAFFGLLVPYVLHQPLITPERRLGAYSEDFVKEAVGTALDLFLHGLEKK